MFPEIMLMALLAMQAQAQVVNPDVTQLTIGRTICVRGWTKTIRPPMQYTDALKLKQMKVRGLPGPASLYEEDHFIPLECGGHPTDPGNLWPQPWNGACSAHVKDLDENRCNKLVCAGRMTLISAQQALIAKWIGCKKTGSQ